MDYNLWNIRPAPNQQANDTFHKDGYKTLGGEPYTGSCKVWEYAADIKRRGKTDR